MNLFNKRVICYFHYLKSILNNVRLKITSTQWFLLIQNICYNKKSLLFQLAAFKIYAIIKTVVSVGCHEYLTEAVTERCSLNQLKSENMIPLDTS